MASDGYGAPLLRAMPSMSRPLGPKNFKGGTGFHEWTAQLPGGSSGHHSHRDAHHHHRDLRGRMLTTTGDHPQAGSPSPALHRHHGDIFARVNAGAPGRTVLAHHSPSAPPRLRLMRIGDPHVPDRSPTRCRPRTHESMDLSNAAAIIGHHPASDPPAAATPALSTPPPNSPGDLAPDPRPGPAHRDRDAPHGDRANGPDQVVGLRITEELTHPMPETVYDPTIWAAESAGGTSETGGTNTPRQRTRPTSRLHSAAIVVVRCEVQAGGQRDE